MKRLFFAIGLMCLAGISFAETVKIPDGDTKALIAAVKNPSVDTIELAEKGVYQFDTQYLVVASHKMLEGNGASLQGEWASYLPSRSSFKPLIRIEKGAELQLKNITIGNAPRGVLNRGVLHAHGVEFSKNSLSIKPVEKDIGGGSALLNFGVAFLVDAVFHDNTTKGHDYSGGAVMNYGDLTIKRGVFIDNTFKRFGGEVEGMTGIDVFNLGRAEIINTQFLGGGGWWGGYIVNQKVLHHSVVNASSGQMTLKHVSIIGRNLGHYWSGDALMNFGAAKQVALINSYVRYLPKNNITTKGMNFINHGSSETTPAFDVSIFSDKTYLRRLPLWGHENGIAGLFAGVPLIDAADPEYCLPKDMTGRLRDDLCDVGAFEWHEEDFSEQMDGMSGSWVLEGAEHSKEGILIEALEDDRVQVFWLGYDSSERPSWLIGQGKVNHGVLPIKLSKPKVSRVNPPLFASQLSIAPFDMERAWDTDIVFIDCQHAVMAYGLFPWQWVRLRRLTVPKNVTGCGGLPEVSQFTQKRRIDAGMSGTWYPADQPGQGLFVEVLADNKMQAFYFGYPKEQPELSEGRLKQMVLIGHGETNGAVAKLKAYTVLSASGHARENKDWGTMTLKFNSCNDAEVWFDGVDGKDYLKLKRLTRWAGNSCK